MLNFQKFFVTLAVLSMPFSIEASSKYDLDDFEGNYISYTFSAGGASLFILNSALTAPGPFVNSGVSVSAISQFFIDKRGNGIINFLSYSEFSGNEENIFLGFAAIIRTVNGVPTFPFTVQITDPVHGVGNFVFTDYPVTGENQTYGFVSIKHDGKIREIYLNATSITAPGGNAVPSPLQTVATRQKGC